MRGNWDSYLCRIDGNLASMLVDLELAETSPQRDFPYMAYISAGIKTPDTDGLPLQEEYERLGQLEDHLEKELTGAAQGIYAGRAACDGLFTLFFYIKDNSAWNERAAAAMAAFAEYEWESGSHSDPQWENYHVFLFPDEYAMNGMQNRRALNELRNQGDDTEKSREIEHWAVFLARSDAEAFALEITNHGFSVLPGLKPVSTDRPEVNGHAPAAGLERSSLAPEPGAGGRPEAAPVSPLPVSGDRPDSPPAEGFAVHFTRPDAPEAIDEITYALIELAHASQGNYQGWACTVME